MFSIASLVVTVLMTWAPFLVSNFPRIASVRAAFDRRRLLTVNPSCALFCGLLPSFSTGARPERLGQATIKIFALDQKTPRANVSRRACPLCAKSRHQPASDWPFITAPNRLYGLVFCDCNHGAGERAVWLPQLIQNRKVIGVGDRYQVAWDMPQRTVGVVIAAARDHGRQLAGAVGDTQRFVDDRPPHRREVLDFVLAQFHLVVDMRGVAQRAEIEH